MIRVFIVVGAIIGLTVALLGFRGMTSSRRPLMLIPDMDDQPRYEAQSESRFFADGRTNRVPPAGTVAFGGRDYASDAGHPRQDPDFLEADSRLFRGKEGDKWVAKNPLPLSMAVLARGQERYQIHCAVCHGNVGAGDGIATKYGMAGVPSYHDQRLRTMPDGEVFNTITNGKGLMMPYGPQVKVRDRWAIVAYLRALQRSQNASLADVPRSQQGGACEMTRFQDTPADLTIPTEAGRRFLAIAVGLALAAIVASGIGYAVDPGRLGVAYLTAFAFVASIVAGSLFWVMIHHLTDAGWSTVFRRLFENVARIAPLLLLLFIPIAVLLTKIYGWTDAQSLASDPMWKAKRPWLNESAFIARSLFYLLVWSGLAWRLSGWSRSQDESHDEKKSLRMRTMSAPGMILLALTSTFAAFDWLMSLDWRWYSTIYGVLFWSGCFVASLSTVILTILGLHRAGWLRQTIRAPHLHDLAKLLFGFVVFWAYIAFSQYFLIWYANMPEETEWYILRRNAAWNPVSWALMAGHFVIPFFFLLPRAVKRHPVALAGAAIWILAFHYLDLYWQVMPSQSPESSRPHWLDLTTLVALVALAVAAGAWTSLGRPLIPTGDPRLEESLAVQDT